MSKDDFNLPSTHRVSCQGAFVLLLFGSCGTRRARDKVKICGRAKMSPLWRVGVEDSTARKPPCTSVAPESCSSAPTVPRVPYKSLS